MSAALALLATNFESTVLTSSRGALWYGVVRPKIMYRYMKSIGGTQRPDSSGAVIGKGSDHPMS